MSSLRDLVVTPEDRAVATRVRRVERRAAEVGRDVVASMLWASISDTGHEYLVTSVGKFRMAPAHNSDNNTELREHARCGAEIVNMADREQMARFFEAHGYHGSLTAAAFYRMVRERLC